VPITIIRSQSEQQTNLLMAERDATLSLGRGNAPTAEDWLKVNAGQTGFYRVNYPNEEWMRLRAAVDALQLPATDRLGLQNDAYALVRAGFAPATLFLSLAEAYASERTPRFGAICRSTSARLKT
jgi:puromycin-sensitive aminopeptidase